MTGLAAGAQTAPQTPPASDPTPAANEAAPRSDDEPASPPAIRPGSRKPKSEPRPAAAEESSSRDTKIDLSPPPGDMHDHPESTTTPDDVQEFHNYDPHRAEKNVEIGDYYFKLSNYIAAESRYREALEYKPNDAVATYRLATALDHLGKVAAARQNYQTYIKILPLGPYAKESKDALQRLASAAPETANSAEKRKEAKYSKATSQLVKKPQ